MAIYLSCHHKMDSIERATGEGVWRQRSVCDRAEDSRTVARNSVGKCAVRIDKDDQAFPPGAIALAQPLTRNLASRPSPTGRTPSHSVVSISRADNVEWPIHRTRYFGDARVAAPNHRRCMLVIRELGPAVDRRFHTAKTTRNGARG